MTLILATAAAHRIKTGGPRHVIVHFGTPAAMTRVAAIRLGQLPRGPLTIHTVSVEKSVEKGPQLLSCYTPLECFSGLHHTQGGDDVLHRAVRTQGLYCRPRRRLLTPMPITINAATFYIRGRRNAER
jgi:hypothetical protein